MEMHWHLTLVMRLFSKLLFDLSLFSHPSMTNKSLIFQIEDEMIQCIICEDWFHGRVCNIIHLPLQLHGPCSHGNLSIHTCKLNGLYMGKMLELLADVICTLKSCIKFLFLKIWNLH